MSAPLVIAVPAKGRLQENAEAFFAIAAIAFDRRAVVVDANVERVVARLFAISTPLPQAKPLIRERSERRFNFGNRLAERLGQRVGVVGAEHLRRLQRRAIARDPQCPVCGTA